jgi:hypothetical protein
VSEPGGGVLHITNGDAAVPVLRGAGVDGPILPWRDVLHEGPVPAVDSVELSRIRSRFLVSLGGAAPDVVDLFAERDAMLDAADELVLWFEHDLYDQLQLVQVLASSDAPAALVQAGTYLGEAELPQPVVVSEEQRATARRAWAAFRAPDPRSLEALDCDGLPFLRPALDRLLEEYPAVRNGLGRSEQQALEAVAVGAANRMDAFLAAQTGDEPRFMGDTTFFVLLDRLEPLVGRDPELGLTPLGEEVLAGHADFVTARWIGGVEFKPPSPRWRWDHVDRRLVTMLAA